MGWKLRSRKSVKVAPGVRVNLSKSGVGMSVGNRFARKAVNSSGRNTTTVSPVPGLLSYRSGSAARAPEGSGGGGQIPPAPPTSQPRKPKRPRWHYIVGAVIALFACGGIASVANPPQPKRLTAVAPLTGAQVQASPSVVLPSATPRPPRPTSTARPTKAPVLPTDTPQSAQPTSTPVKAVAAPTKVPAPSSKYLGKAYVDNANPPRNGTVRVFGELTKGGKPVAGARMHSVWQYKKSRSECDGETLTNAQGKASCARRISNATAGYEVEIYVTLTAPDGTKVNVPTSFTPR